MKKFLSALSLTLALCLLAGCAGSPVVYQCTCPTEGQAQTPTEATQDSPKETQPPVVAEGEVKTGLAIVTSVAKSASASAEAEGKADYDVTVAAVNVDEKGVITACYLDSIGASVKFDAEGMITSDTAAAVLTKNELGDDYGMKAKDGGYGAKYEWYEQTAALADYAVGKTVSELRTGAVNESGKAADADLATVATISLAGYVDAIEAAVNNARYLGAQAGDTLKAAVLASMGDSKSSETEKAGNAQLNVDAAAITMNGEIITSCAIDSVQAKVAFDTTGTITSDITAPVLTKNQLGDDYGMKAKDGGYGAKFEWYEQAASFAAYVTGKTAAEVAGIAVDEGSKPTDADLTASVTIAVGGFQALIAKAAK